MLRVFCFLFLIITANTSNAKWAGYEEADIKRTLNNYSISIKKDGSSENISEEEFEILKESGRDYAAHYTLFYDGDSEKIEIIEAKTIYQGKEYPIDPKFIEDKPLASASDGFDQMHQILLAFPKVEIGSKIYLKWKTTHTKSPLANFFADFFDFGKNEWTTNANLKLNSELPLHILVNDPENSLKITKDKEDNFQNLEISLTKEIYKSTINEPQNGIENPELYTWVSVSSLNKWEDFSKAIAKQNFNKIYNQNLPIEFAHIAKIASEKEGELEQINSVTSMLSEKIQYLSDRTSVEGRFAPRNLEQVSNSQLGDCKDFSSATVAILSKMGYKAQFALVMRGEGNFAPYTLPYIGAFNHVMVKITSKTSKIYWIDPTNLQSMAGGIFPDIANKPSLVLDSNEPVYEKTPSIDPNHAQILTYREIEIFSDYKVVEKGTITLKNEEAFRITGAELVTSKSNIEDSILNSLSGTNLDSTNKKEITIPDLKSRIVKDIAIEYSFQQDNKLSQTNLGKALKLNYNKLAIDNFIHASQDTVCNLYIGEPYSYKRKTIIKNIDAKNAESLNKEIRTKWIDISRKLSFKNRTLTIDETITAKQELILNKDLITPEFLELKGNLEQNFRDVLLVFN